MWFWKRKGKPSPFPVSKFKLVSSEKTWKISTKTLCDRQESHASRSWRRKKIHYPVYRVALLMASPPFCGSPPPSCPTAQCWGTVSPRPTISTLPTSLNSPKPKTSNSCIMAETATPLGLGLTTPFSSSSPFWPIPRLSFPGQFILAETTRHFFLQITSLTQYSFTVWQQLLFELVWGQTKNENDRARLNGVSAAWPTSSKKA